MVEASTLAIITNNVRLGMEAAATIFAAVMMAETVLAIAGIAIGVIGCTLRTWIAINFNVIDHNQTAASSESEAKVPLSSGLPGTNPIPGITPFIGIFFHRLFSPPVTQSGTPS